MPSRFRRRSSKRVELAVLAAALSLLLASAAAQDPKPKPKPRPKPVTHTVVTEGLKFQPETLTINLGDSVVWVNKDPFPHTATSKAGGFDSKQIDAGKSWTYTPKTKGEAAYVCTFHPTMTGRLRVR
jgi:plastocyanin